MDDPHTFSSPTPEIKNVLPDVVHSQQIPVTGTVVIGETDPVVDSDQNIDNSTQDVDDSNTESISEHVPSRMECSTDSENAAKPQELLKVDLEHEKVSKNSASVPFPHSPISDNTHDPSKLSTSWPVDINTDVNLISEESPINLALSSEPSKEMTQDNKTHSLTLDSSEHYTPNESPRSDKYLDSLNEVSSHKSNLSLDQFAEKSENSENNVESLGKCSSGSEEIIKLDIRGQGVPKFPFSSAKIIFGPPPEGGTIIDVEQIPVFPNLLSPFLVGAGDSVKVEEVFDDMGHSKEASPEKSIESDKTDESPDKSIESPDKSIESPDKQSLSSDKIEQNDLLVEEITVDDEIKEKESDKQSIPSQPKSLQPEETMSFSTMTTDYKTICEEYHVKLVHLEDAITQRDDLIEELTVSLQRSVRERDDLRTENVHVTNEVQNLQHTIGEQNSDHDTIKAQLSDFIKYETMVKDDSTKFYSALMSGGSSMQSSNSEKDMDREEITVNYSKSDLRSDEDDFQTGFESKVTIIINKFDQYIEENLRNKLRESMIQVLCDEIGKMRIEADTEVKDLESQMQQDKQAYTIETRRLRELLASVKAGSADVDALREELSVKHEKEMENLRTYFEKKCSDMERSYSEEVWRGKVVGSPLGSASSLEGQGQGDGEGGGGGDRVRRRTRSADLPSLSLESTQVEQALKQISKRYEQQIEDMRTEHVAYVKDVQARHAGACSRLEEQITQLKAHIQTAENTEANVSLYQQDIDLELEKRMEGKMEDVREEVKQEVVQHLQEQLQVLLSDPDAEVSSWPLELVALRDKIHGDAKLNQEKEFSSLRDELSSGEDKWKQRRNLSFDQNRHLEEVTKERDELKSVAVSLHRVVGQLVAYCASAEDELNHTVLAQLLARLLPDEHDNTGTPAPAQLDLTLGDDSRPSTPNLSELNSSLVSRSGKHVHFAPDLNAILSELDEDGLVGLLQHQRDLSADIKKELEHSLRRLRHEAHSLLDLSTRLANKGRNDSKMLESSQVQITELDQDQEEQRSCDNCELHRKNMEEAMAECLQRENLLRGDLEAAMIKIAQLMTSADIIAEGYGTGQQLNSPMSLTRARRGTGTESGSVSLDGTCSGTSPRDHLARVTRDLDVLHKERDDLHQQLEAANRQLRSTRQFVEEQATEREAERDEFARRLDELRDENSRLSTRLQNNARILNEMHCLRLSYYNCRCREHDAHVEQLEAQTREMNQIITELETRKASTDDELKATEEKITILRDIIANLETQLEQKIVHEKEILMQLEEMKKTIEDRDSKMRSVIGELEALRSEIIEQSDVMCVKCGQEEDKYNELMENIKEQCGALEQWARRRSAGLERRHEVWSGSCSEPSEDVSLRDQRDHHLQEKSPEPGSTPRVNRMCELEGVWECLETLARAEDVALKRIADLEMQREQLKDVAQEVRAERDVLQTRMSEQALKISSLSARLQQHRNDADALSHQATSHLSVQLHDALAEVRRLKEELESKDKQLVRLKHNLEERDKLSEQHHSLYGNSCNPKDKVMILERELSSAQTRIAQLESFARSLEKDKEEMQISLRDHQRALAEKEDQLQELLALKLDDDIQKDEKSEVLEGKTSARTLSDIVSISEFDEHDVQMRRAELKAHNISLTGAPFETTDKTQLNRTLPPELQRLNMSSLNIDFGDHFDLPNYTPRADSLPVPLTSTQNKDMLKQYKRNVNETTMFGTLDKLGDPIKHSTAQKIQDNCSMYPNRDVDESKNVSVEPKKINFSLETTGDKKLQHEEEFTSLRELGITLDIKQENFPDILTQLKHEIKKSRTELENCKSELKNAEEQLCEFPALKEEVEELKGLLENTMATMANDKKFYENQLDNFSSNKKLLEQRLTELTQEVNDKSKDLHLLKEDILRRENMILELAKEKRNLTNKMTELEVKLDELQSRNTVLEKYETENHQMREKINELQKLEQLVSEKNHQIDSLNQHLDRLDDLQRCLNDKTEELEQLKEALKGRSDELFQMQDTIAALNRDVANSNEENNKLNIHNKDLRLKLTKLEKDQENASLRLQNSDSELQRVNSLNNELTSKIEELKLLTDQLKDKETEIEILHEDINSFHEEIASLKEQLKMVSRSPSPKSKRGDEKTLDRQASSDKKQLVKIRKLISLIQHELDFTKRELNDKAFELAKAKLDVAELRNNLSQATKQVADKDTDSLELKQHTDSLQREIEQLKGEKQELTEQLEAVVARMREESNVSELKSKLRKKAERCQELENELQDMRELVERGRMSPVGDHQTSLELEELHRSVAVRSPTAELEKALRDQLHYSHTLDDDIMDQILSASSDEREDIPRLVLNTSKSSSSIHSSSSERMQRLRAENDKLLMQLNHLEARLKDKDALITELNRVRDKLVSDWQSYKLRYEAERDSAGRLQLLLDTHKETADTLQNQDSNMIQILKKRLESSMHSELELQQRDQQQRARLAQLERLLLDAGADAGDSSIRGQLQNELDNKERLKGEITLLKSKLEVERNRYSDLQASLEHVKLQAQRELDNKNDLCASLRNELAEVKRLKHDSSVELLRLKELLSTKNIAIQDMEKKLTSPSIRHKPIDDALSEIQEHKSELAREIATLKKCLSTTNVVGEGPELARLRADRVQLSARVDALERELRDKARGNTDERDQAIRYLHGRCLRLESCRKALVWQKRYLQRVLAGYSELERNLRLPSSRDVGCSRGKKRFKCIATVVMVVVRMEYLVRRRHHVRALSANCLLRTPQNNNNINNNMQCGQYPGTPGSVPRAMLTPVPVPAPAHSGTLRHTESLARRVLTHDKRFNLPASPGLGEFMQRSPYSNSPQEGFILNSPRGEGAAYLNKLELVSRCLNRAMNASPDKP